jgi:adenylylsulfate kinase
MIALWRLIPVKFCTFTSGGLSEMSTHKTRENAECYQFGAQAILWLTGLSGAGKSTIATSVKLRLQVFGISSLIVDGDVLRSTICSDLGFSREDRRKNVQRAGELVLNNIDDYEIIIVAMISPFADDRKEMQSRLGTKRFHEIYCNASMHECQRRDVKGLYQRASSGEIKMFTGLTSPYEVPNDPALVLTTGNESVASSVQTLLDYLVDCGVLCSF